MSSYVSCGYICWRVANILLNLSICVLLPTSKLSGISLSFDGNINLGAFGGFATLPAMFVIGLTSFNYPGVYLGYLITHNFNFTSGC